MLLVIPLFNILFLFLAARSLKSRSTVFLIILLIGWLINIVLVTIGMLQGIIYAVSFLISYCSLCFALFYVFRPLQARRAALILAVVPVLQVIFLFLGEEGFLKACSLFLLTASAALLVYHFVRCNIRVIRAVNFSVAMAFLNFSAVYAAVFLYLPITVVETYKIYILCFCGIGVLSPFIVFFRFTPMKGMIEHKQIIISKPFNQFGDNFSVICHSLKNQLICLDEDVLTLSYTAGDKQKLLAGIAETRDRINNMFDNISLLNTRLRTSTLELKLISLTELCREVLDDKYKIPREVILSKRIPVEEVKCSAHREHIKNCIFNILPNAVEAFPPEKGVISFQMELVGKWAVITIIDNGRGIPHSELEQIFQPFYTTKSGNKNWGIGLSLCRSIVMAHGGALYAENAQEGGAKFKLLLPVIY